MAEPFVLLFDNVAWRPWSGLAVSTNVSTSNSPVSMRYPQALDASRATVWKVTTSHGTFIELEIDRGAAQTAETDYPMALGLFNHNLGDVSPGVVAVQRSTNGSTYTTMFDTNLATSPIGSDDYIFVSDQDLPADRYLRILFFFVGGGGPVTNDFTIGQIYIGKAITLTDDEAATIPVQTPYRFAADIQQGGGGGRIVRSRGVREQPMPLSFRGKTSGFRTKIQAFLNRQDGPKWPFGLHTHRHTDTPWETTGFAQTNLDARGGAYFMQIDADTLPWSEVFEATDDFQLPAVRHMGSSET